ncbi:hypothetical protein N3C_2491 [Clostridium sp. N3C]|uniref:hypothetical protein n=1 Tax=Clostridium sp. N3C TaxID=1776758 RepID=UPI00092E0D60|nr:hypothetical protein [Clostridium sp. N3C]SCN25774.1 hypothetical protein N3C_2491 [Clostridium sp. N3C]
MRTVDTKIIYNKNGWLLHLVRTRDGILDTITLQYPMKTGIKSVTKRNSFPFWLGSTENA